MFRLGLSPERATALVIELEQLIADHIVHPAIAAPVAAGLEAPTAYLVLEYAVGESLDVVLQDRGRLSIEEAVRLVESVGEGIDAAADKGVAHGLLHPRDIIIGPEGARVTGFGIAAALAVVGEPLPERQAYAAPGQRSDIYSLAAVAFEAISGRQVSPDALVLFEREHGRELREVFSAALAPTRAARPRRAVELAARLRGALGSRRELAPAFVRSLDPPVVQPEPEFDNATIARFADLGAATDLRLDADVPEDLDASDDVDISDMAELPEPEPGTGHRRGWRTIPILLVAGLIIGLAGGYVARFRSSTVSPPASTVEPPVSETVVDLPPSTPPPAPAPSRPASGAMPPAPAATDPPPARGNLVIRSTPPNAEVLVNGRARGKTPLSIRDLALGSYTIRVAHDGYAAESREVRLTPRDATAAMDMSLRPIAPASSALPPSSPSSSALPQGSPGSSPAGGDAAAGTLNVQSRPAGARVFVNDRLAGVTPLAVQAPSGTTAVRIEMDGYQGWATTVEVTATQQTRVNASLEVLRGPR